MKQDNEQHALRLESEGTLMYPRERVPMTVRDWNRLKTLARKAQYDYVVGGDADEQHSVRVARFVNDVERPEDLSELTDDVRNIVMSDDMLDFYHQFTGTTELCLRRCQANLLRPGDYIGVHKDQDSNPDYIATVVFHFDSVYEGGDFVTHGEDGRSQIHPEPWTLLVNNCEIPHEVTRITSGERLTLACFLSREFGASPIAREAIRLSY